MDLSDLSVEDLHAIQAKKWDDVSAPGLQAYQQHLQQKQQAIQQSQNPQNQTVPDAAQKVSQPSGQQYLSPGESATDNYWTKIKDRITDPNRWKAIATGEGPAAPDTVGSDLGAAGLAIPMESAPSALAKLASYLGGSGIGPALGRIAANAGLGAVQGATSDSDPNKWVGAGMGAAVGAGAGTLGEAVGGLASATKWGGRQLARMTAPQGEAYVNDPSGVKSMANALDDPSQMPGLQDQAVQAINNSRKALKAQGLQAARTLSENLSNKYVPVNPQEIEQAAQNLHGIDPRADEILDQYRVKIQGNPGEQILDDSNVMRTVGATPDTSSTANAVSMPANEANALKRYLQEGARFAQGTVTQPVQPAAIKEAAQTAAGLRSGIEQVSPEAAALNKQMQDGMMLQEALRKGAKNSPLAFVSSQSPDRISTLARSDASTDGGLLDFGNKLGAAKTMTAPDHGSGVPTFVNKMIGRGIMRGANSVQGATEADPVAIQALLKGLFDTDSKQ